MMLTRILACAVILSYGIFIASNQKQLERLFHNIVANDDATSPEDDAPRIGHHHDKHIRTFKNSTSSVRISFELHDPKTVPLNNVFNLYVKCPLGPVTVSRRNVPTGEHRSGELPSALINVTNELDYRGVMRSGRVLDLTVTISTDLKLLLIGDSVMVQLAQAVDEIMGGDVMQTRKVVWEAWRGHDGGTVVAPTRGGGVSALWRMTGLLSMTKKGKPPANSAGGGWGDKEIISLSNYSYHPAAALSNGGQMQQQNLTNIGDFDVVIFRVMHGWMKIHEITYDRVVEAVQLSHELLGATTVVLMTVPFTNNVKTLNELTKVKQLNDDIRDIARKWHLRNTTTGVRHVLVLEYEDFYNHIIWSNARHLGYNVSHPLRATKEVFDTEGPTFLFDRLQTGEDWPASIPMVCSDSPGPDKKKCNRNYLFSDGMHTCPERLASRYAAGLACLIGCVYNGKESWRGGSNNTTIVEEERIRTCERECNEQFLSVAPVEESWIDSSTTLASFSDPIH